MGDLELRIGGKGEIFSTRSESPVGFTMAARMGLRRLPPLSESDIVRFWERVDRRGTDDCWLWKSTTLPRGRGIFSFGGANYMAPRVSWKIHTGLDPYPHDVLHECPGGDNQGCVNPRHLRVGGASENMLRAYATGQKPSLKGTRRKRKLSPEDELSVLESYRAMRVSLDDLASVYGVGKSTISRVINGHFGGPRTQGRRAKLSWGQLEGIRVAYVVDGVPIRVLAERYDVGESTIRRAIFGQFKDTRVDGR